MAEEYSRTWRDQVVQMRPDASCLRKQVVHVEVRRRPLPPPRKSRNSRGLLREAVVVAARNYPKDPVFENLHGDIEKIATPVELPLSKKQRIAEREVKNLDIRVRRLSAGRSKPDRVIRKRRSRRLERLQAKIKRNFPISANTTKILGKPMGLSL